MFNKNINFSTEFQYRVSLKKQQFITWYSSLHFILLKMTISSPLKLETSTTSYSRFGIHFDDRPKILTYRQIPPNISYLRLSYENKSKSSTEYWFVFKETPFTIKGCTDLHTPDIYVSSKTAIHRDAVRVSFICIYHWLKWYQKQIVFN